MRGGSKGRRKARGRRKIATRGHKDRLMVTALFIAFRIAYRRYDLYTCVRAVCAPSAVTSVEPRIVDSSTSSFDAVRRTSSLASVRLVGPRPSSRFSNVM